MSNFRSFSKCSCHRNCREISPNKLHAHQWVIWWKWIQRRLLLLLFWRAFMNFMKLWVPNFLKFYVRCRTSKWPSLPVQIPKDHCWNSAQRIFIHFQIKSVRIHLWVCQRDRTLCPQISNSQRFVIFILIKLYLFKLF